MTLEYSISELYRLAFGYVGLPYPAQQTADVTYSEAVGIYSEALDIIGKPLFLPTKLGDVWLPNAPIVNISLQKRIVQTPVTGRRFTVKETLSSD